MASRTKQKEEARARRLAEEQARAESTRRQRRLRTVGGTVLGAVVIVVAAVLISSGGNSGGGLKTGTEANATVAAVDAMFAGIPQSGPVLGNPKAPVTMTYFGDYQCPICADFTLSGGFPELVSNDVRSGKVKVDYASYCTATCNGPNPGEFNTQQVAGLAAGKQNKFWNYTELFYRQQGQEGSGYVNENFLTSLAQQTTGLNISTWKSDRSDPALTTQVNADQATAKNIGVSGTPTLIFKGPKGQAVPPEGVPTYAQLEQAVKQVS
jgi:protein-disulfide isomerase